MTTEIHDAGSIPAQANQDSPPEVRAAIRRMRENQAEQIAGIDRASQGLHRLVSVMGRKTGQSYKVRGLLYSLWNGQPASLLEIVTLDWEIRKDLLAVLQAFGTGHFFYDELSAPIKHAGLFNWFCEEAKEEADHA